jgi:gatB/yqey domain protein
LAEPELAQVAVIEKFLPKQLSEAEVTEAVKAIIAEVGATSAKDMGKVMGVATKQLAGKTDGKVISAIVKSLLA